MKVYIDHEQRRFYRDFHYLGFEEFFPSESLDELSRSIGDVLKKRKGTGFLAGRDLWRDHDGIRRLEGKKIWAETAADLFRVKKLVLAFDQYFPPEGSLYSELYPEAAPLETLFSIQGLVGVAVLCLKGEREAPIGPFPSKAGEVTYFSATTPVDFSLLKENKELDLLAVGFASFDSCYILQERDPNTHFCKKYGMVYGDLLLKTGHPILCS